MQNDEPIKIPLLTHDTFFEEMFKILELAAAFLRNVLPPKIVEQLDFDRISIESKEFLSIVFKETRADMIYRVPIIGSEQTLCVYVLLEHKSSNDFWTIHQSSQYANQIGLREIQIAKDAEKFNAEFRLSPVLMIIFHHGETAFTGPTNVSDVYRKIDGIEDYLPSHKAILYDLRKIPESELPNDPNVPELGVVLRIMQMIFEIDIGTRSRDVLEKLRPFSEQPKYRRIIRFLWVYMMNSARRQKKQNLKTITETIKSVIGEKEMTAMTSILEDLIAEGEARGVARGEARGEAQGEAKGVFMGKRNAIINILRARFRLQSVPNAIVQRLSEIGDSIVLDSLTVMAATCETLDEFENAL